MEYKKNYTDTFTNLLYNRINDFYKMENKTQSQIKKLTDILEGKSNLSLRIIDWFVTNYAKIFNTHYNLNEYKLKREHQNKKSKSLLMKTHKKDKISRLKILIK